MSKRRLKIGVSCYNSWGGSGAVAVHTSQELAKRGHEVHIISFGLPKRFDDTVGNIFFHEVDTLEYPLFNHPPFSISLASKMVDICRNEDVDILHVHYAVPLATSAYLAKEVLGASAPSVVTTLHGTDITLVGKDPSFLPITRFSIDKSDWVTTPSKYLKKETYQELGVSYSKEIDVIPNFVDTQIFTPSKNDKSREDGVFTLVHVSNFRPVKRVDDVIRVFDKVLKRFPKSRLLMIGDGPERSKAERLSRELSLCNNTCFLGNRLDFVDKLKEADLFILPSQSESFGLASLEALSCGVPVISTNVGGVPEVVKHREVGLLSDVGDVDGMADNVIKLFENSDLRKKYANNARTMVEEHFRVEQQVDLYEQGYYRLLESKNLKK